MEEKENFEEVSKLRNSLYAEDDNETALSKIGENLKVLTFLKIKKVDVPMKLVLI